MKGEVSFTVWLCSDVRVLQEKCSAGNVRLGDASKVPELWI